VRYKARYFACTSPILSRPQSFNGSTHHRKTDSFSFSWTPNVSTNLQVRTVLVIDTIFLLTVSTTDIDSLIATSQESLSLLHRSHPEYIVHVHVLGITRDLRYMRLHQKEDLDKSILHYTEAIFLPPIRARSFPNFIKILSLLAMALLKRAKEYKQPEGIGYSIKYFRYLRRFPLDAFDVPREAYTTKPLIQALGIRVRLGTGNGTRDIKEMVALCHELLASNKSAVVLNAAFGYLREAADVEFHRGIPSQVLDEVIECLQDAVEVCPPGSHVVLFSLGCTLFNRFIKTHSDEDYEEAAVVLERVLEPGGCPDSVRDVPLAFSTALTFFRSIFLQDPEYSQAAISRLRAEIISPSPEIGEQLRLLLASSLAMQTGLRGREYNLAENLEEANSYTSQAIDLSSSPGFKSGELIGSELGAIFGNHSAAEIQQQIGSVENLLSITPPGTQDHQDYLHRVERLYLSKFYQTNDISDIEESIKYSRLSLGATHANSPWRFLRFRFLHHLLLIAFEKTRKISYLDESITVGYNILNSKTAQQVHFAVTESLVSSLLTRKQLLGGIEDHHEAIRLISVTINEQYASDPDLFRLSCQWAILARNIGHPTTLAAYKTAMSLIQKSLSFAPTVSIQHTRLVRLGETGQKMPLDYASYQIDFYQFEQAVETLEQGRALLWSEMRSLRTPMVQPIEEDEDSLLAKRFAEINQELEALTISVTPSGRPETEGGVAQSRDGTDPFGRLVVKHRKLVKERDALVSKIQGRSGLEGFLRAPTFTTLRSAASHGPVIIINHCRWRSDILIVFHHSLPCSIPTTNDFFARANKLRDELVVARKRGLDSTEYQDALCSVLKGLYELVGEPVIKRLHLLGVPEQSRIWWCPTSVFCSLPLHAMGPIPSTGPGKPQYFSDLYIPSYTPSLSALIDSRKASPQTLKKPSLLLVAQPDDSLPGVTGEIEVILERAIKARVAVTGLVSSRATPSTVLEGLRGSHLAHFACHGALEAGKPFEASFKLHGASRLTLLEIVQSRLPDAEFAFLSCCHAAEITAESISDEALHLTAAMQYCGFRSVVGTMWEMVDTDGRDLAKNFYKSLFSRKDSSVPYYERSAEALRDATQKLRGKRGITLERWVNFVHYGA
jgi:tetratricopeptide (TPR) repeat protein